MTITAFTRKYGLPYNAVYEATYNVHTDCRELYDRDYPEEDLRIALVEIARKRRQKHEQLMKQQDDILRKLGGESDG